MIARSVERALAGGVDEVVVVVGPDGGAVRESLSGLPARFVENPDPRAGQGSSIACGIAALRPGEAALIVLGDQPTIPSQVVPCVIATFRRTRARIVAPVYRGVQGNPVLFDPSVFPELLALTGDRGARSVIERDPRRVTQILFECPLPPDIDTEEDYGRVVNSLYTEG